MIQLSSSPKRLRNLGFNSVLDLFDDEEQSGTSGFVTSTPICSPKNVSDHASDEDETSSTLRETQHTNPNWLVNLKSNFKEVVIDPCSVKTRNAVNNDEEITTPRDYRAVKNEIVNSVLNYLKTMFNLNNLPRVKDVRQICYTMGSTYPSMFQPAANSDPNDDLAPEDFDVLASRMRERLRGQLRYEVKGSSNEHADLEPKKKGRRKSVYGIDMDKWMRAKKPSGEALGALSGTSLIADVGEREVVFEKYRDEIVHEIRAMKNISSFCRGFWMSDRHLANQFTYLTGSPPLNKKVEANLETQFSHMELFLVNQCKTLEFHDEMETIKKACHIEHAGAQTLKYIHLLRFAVKQLDGGEGSELIRIDDDGPSSSSCPHIQSIEVNKNQFHFELWVEQQKLLYNLSLSAAISAFLHLCFTFNLDYPKGAKTVADILQHGWAKYGDDTGTKTGGGVSAAVKKRQFYFATVGKLI